MATVSVELFIHAIHGYDGDIHYSVYQSDMSEYGHAGPVVDRRVVEIEVNEITLNDLMAAQVQSLKKQKEEVLAYAQIKANALQDKIDSLLCLENKEPSHA